MPDLVDVDGLCRAALHAGDRQRALLLLMRTYGDPVHRFCRSMVGEALAEDVHQLTFVHAYQGFERYRGESSLRAWLFGIARHRCLDLLRQQRRKPTATTDTVDDEALDERPADGVLADRDVLEQCLSKLKEPVREAVLLRFVHDLSYPEMGEICGEGPATLQIRVARALPLLRKCVEARSRR